ncbi:MAG: aspartate aminotransferase family protein [bacterium]|nr:aspartate aminotransferase family protein [bacterium]
MKFLGEHRKEEIIQKFARYISSAKANLFKSVEFDLVIGKREGIWIEDIESGRRFINCHSNGGVFNLGHRNPRIISTLKEALDELDIGNHHLISEMRAKLAEFFIKVVPKGIDKVLFLSGGGEAVDVAIKIARAYTKKKKIISAYGGYHGHTGLALSTGDYKYRKYFLPLAPGFIQVPFGDIDYLSKTIDNDTAAVIFETVPATYGIAIPPKDFFKEVKRLCEKYGAILIIDEIQTGLGRTGKLWGIEHFGVVPDVMVVGKGLSGGIYPMAATCFQSKYESVFKKEPFLHVSTFGGSELGCAVALEVLKISSSPEFLKHVNDISRIFAEEFEKMRRGFGEVLKEIRQLGLMMGLKFKNELWGPLMSKACFDHGLLCLYANNNRSVLQVLPPLIIQENEVKEVVSRLTKAIETALDKKYQLKVLSSFLKGQTKNYLEYIRSLL